MLIVEMMHGSHLYGTNSPTSDVDIKGIKTAAPRDVLLGRVPKIVEETRPVKADGVKNAPGDVDRQIFSLHHFIGLALKGETVAIDMLHASDSAIIDSSIWWYILQRERSRFYTKRMSALVGYARHQAAKYGLKGSRLAAAKQAMEHIAAGAQGGFTVENARDALWLWEGPHTAWIPASPEHNGLAMYEVCGMKFQQTCKLSYVRDRLDEFIKRYGERAKAAESNAGVDWKAVSHAFRAAYQMKSILVNGGFSYPLVETDVILAVKQGKIPYKEAGPQLETLIDEVEDLATKSTLPETPNKEWAEEFLLKATAWSVDHGL